ncbi:MAG: outer membrane beta-barrel protein [Cyclobacteriaceae bacterium]|nr:outer membrane beta-barrel protein [Cyclobacteriaceae bacterium]
MKAIPFIIIFFCVYTLQAQSPQDLKLPEPKRFIDKIEIFAGPSLSFNYGNKFIENYKDDNIESNRFVKMGYSIGVGVYHPLSDRIDFNLRLQYDQKGRKTELNTPSNPPSIRRLGIKNYNYNYLTVSLAPRISVGINKRFFISVGAYCSKIQAVKGYEKITDSEGQIFLEDTFKGRFFEDTNNDGGVYSITWIPGLQSFETYDIGGVLSIGYSLPIGENHILTIQIIDNYGLTNINKDKPYGQEEKNHNIQLLLGYTLIRKN